MDQAEFLRALEEALAVAPGTLEPGTALADVKEWDSLGVVEFQSLVDEHFDVQVPPPQISSCETVADLLGLVGGKLG